MSGHDRRSYDLGASGEVQANVNRIAGRLETLIGQRASDAGIALGDFEAGDVSADYSDKERKWGDAASQTMEIVRLLRKVMGDNDQTATDTMSRARAAVASIA